MPESLSSIPSPFPQPDKGVLAAVGLLSHGSYVLTSTFQDTRAGVCVRWVTRCANEPVLVCVVVRKGHFIEPVIRDSRSFGLCAVDPGDRLLARKFAEDAPEDDHDDPFNSVPTRRLKTGSPILLRSRFALDCEVVRHFDLEADCELYVGLVVAGWIPTPPSA